MPATSYRDLQHALSDAELRLTCLEESLRTAKPAAQARWRAAIAFERWFIASCRATLESHAS